MSDRIELPDRGRLHGVAQRARFWCVPAAVASMLTYHDIHVSQEDLVLAYCQRFEGKGPLSRLDGSAVPLDGLSPNQIVDAARSAKFVHANFKHFGEIAHDVVNLTKQGIRFSHSDGIDPGDLIPFVGDRLKAGCPVGVSAQSGPLMFHVCVAFGATADALYCYDPARGADVELRRGTTGFTKDVLVLEPSRA